MVVAGARAAPGNTMLRQRVFAGLGSAIQREEVWFASVELAERLQLRIDTDLNILLRQGLLHEYRIDTRKVGEQQSLPYTLVKPNTFGVLLYAAAHNKVDEWRSFNRQDFGDFPDVQLPTVYEPTLDQMAARAGVTQTPPPSGDAE